MGDSYVSPGPRGAGYADIRFDEVVDDASITKQFEIDARQFDHLSIDAWAEDQNVDVAIKRLVGYDTSGDKIWEDEVASQVLTAASNADAVDPATEVTNVLDSVVRRGIYAVFANKSGGTAGTLHILGTAKA